MFASGFSKAAGVTVIKTLGKGGEGIAHLVHHPRFGKVVRKTYNITGKLFSKPIFEKKLEILKKVRSPYLPKFYGQEGTKPITYHEYVRFTKARGRPSKARQTAIEALNAEVKATTGTGIKDLAHDNFVRDRRGHFKAIDFLIDGPLKRTSRHGQLQRAMKSGGPSAVGKLLRSFDREAISHKSRREILRNAQLPRAQRDKLILKATKPE